MREYKGFQLEQVRGWIKIKHLGRGMVLWASSIERAQVMINELLAG
jgi:hypothetical protein